MISSNMQIQALQRNLFLARTASCRSCQDNESNRLFDSIFLSRFAFWASLPVVIYRGTIENLYLFYWFSCWTIEDILLVTRSYNFTTTPKKMIQQNQNRFYNPAQKMLKPIKLKPLLQIKIQNIKQWVSSTWNNPQIPKNALKFKH